MHVLVVGGTSFVGRHLTSAALDAGHEVTLANRGRTGPHLFPQAHHLRIDRNRNAPDLSALRGKSWDATLDICAYWPGQVQELAEQLDGRGGHHLQVSSVSAYTEDTPAGADESAALAELAALGPDAVADPDALEMSVQTYGPLKAACERVAVDLFGAASTTIIRPTYVVGPHDPTGRFNWWLDRISRGGPMLCPGPSGAALQVIDARDQAAFALRLVEQQVSGAFHICSPAPPWTLGDLVDVVQEALAVDVQPVWAPADWLLEREVDGATFPLWSEGGDEGVMAMDPSRALAAGLSPRPLVDTVRESWAWMQAGGSWRRAGNGIAPEREEQLLAELAGG
jgi:2'-hydroxyisoflavone reductase